MAKKLSEIAEFIDNSVEEFMKYLEINVDEEVNSRIAALSGQTEVYIFSGIIRNFFLGKNEIRDIDIVLKEEMDIEPIFKGFDLRKNSFGGYKIKKVGSHIDLWFLETTWAFQHQRTLNFDLDKYIPSTAFFNFSTIIFSYNEKRFYYTNHFLKFLRDREIDVAYEPNANYALCVVNTFYYSDKYDLKIANKLKKHLLYLDRRFKNNYSTAQVNHFGRILYTEPTIKLRLEEIARSITPSNETHN